MPITSTTDKIIINEKIVNNTGGFICDADQIEITLNGVSNDLKTVITNLKNNTEELENNINHYECYAQDIYFGTQGINFAQAVQNIYDNALNESYYKSKIENFNDLVNQLANMQAQIDALTNMIKSIYLSVKQDNTTTNN